jgi:hypothetical protein
MMCPRQLLVSEWKFSTGLLQVHLIHQGPNHHQYRYHHHHQAPLPAYHWELMNLDPHPDFAWTAVW